MGLPGCSVCLDAFDDDRTPMVVVTCGHTLCHRCLAQLRPTQLDEETSLNFQCDDLVACPTCRRCFHRVTDASRLFLNFPQQASESDLTNLTDLTAEERSVLIAYAACEHDATMLRSLAQLEYVASDSYYMTEDNLVVLVGYAAKHGNAGMMRAIVERATADIEPCDALISALVRVIHEGDAYTSFVWYFSTPRIDDKLFFGHACALGDTRVHEAIVYAYSTLRRAGDVPVQVHYTFDHALAWHALLARPVDANCVRTLLHRGATGDGACAVLAAHRNLSLCDVHSIDELLDLGCSPGTFDSALNWVVDAISSAGVLPSALPGVHVSLQRMCQIVKQQPSSRTVAVWDDIIVRLLLRIRALRVRYLGTMRTARSWTAQRWHSVQYVTRCCDILEAGLAETLWHIREVFS